MEGLLNWIAEGLAATSLVACGLHLASGVSASTRCRVWWATMAGIIGAGGVPWLPASSSGAAGFPGSPGLLGSAEPFQFSVTVPLLPSWLMMTAVFIWVFVVAAALLRLGIALIALRAMKRTGQPLDEWRERRLPVWQSLRGRGRSVRLAISSRVEVPSVMGLGTPVVLLPAHLMREVTDRELDQIVVHEYAHAQRYDDWTGLAQYLIRAFLWFHPALRWIDRALTLEREVACDDWVVALTGSRKDYARLLTRVVERTGRSAGLALALARFQPMIAVRVTRLLDSRRGRTTRMSARELVTTAAVFITAVGTAALVPFSQAMAELPAPVSIQARAEPDRLTAATTTAVPAPAVTMSRRPRPPVILIESASATAVEPLPREDAIVAEPEAAPPDLAPLTATALNAMALFDGAALAPLSNPFAGRQVSDRAAWAGFAAAGTSIARGAGRAGSATAGYFSRVGSSIADTF